MNALYLCLLLACGLKFSAADIECALILEHRWATFRNSPPFSIDHDPIRKNLRHGMTPTPPPSCHYYKIDDSCDSGPVERSVACVECSHPSSCQGKDSEFFSMVLNQNCRGRWKLVGQLLYNCTCDLVQGNYIFV